MTREARYGFIAAEKTTHPVRLLCRTLQRSEVLSYFEDFYNPRRRHSRLGNLSPADYERTITTGTEVSG